MRCCVPAVSAGLQRVVLGKMINRLAKAHARWWQKERQEKTYLWSPPIAAAAEAMSIVTANYRYKRPPGRKKPVAIEQAVVTPGKWRKGT